MAKVTFTSDIQSISGKLCKKEGIVYSVNKQTGVTHRSDRHSYNDANTEAQKAIRTTFATRAHLAAKWWMPTSLPSQTRRAATATSSC